MACFLVARNQSGGEDEWFSCHLWSLIAARIYVHFLLLLNTMVMVNFIAVLHNL